MSDHVRFVLVREWLRLDREWGRAKEERGAAQQALISAEESLRDLGTKRVVVEGVLDSSAPGWRDDPDVKTMIEFRRSWILTPAGAYEEPSTETPDARA